MPYKRHYISADTEQLLNSTLKSNIRKYCKLYRVEPALILAIIQQESRHNTFAIRYERKLKRTKWYNNLLTKTEKKDRYSYCSMGAGQILFGIAKSHGYKGKPFDLLSPTNIKYVIYHVRQLIRQYYYIEDVVSAYNQGSPRKDKHGLYKNQTNYVNPVLRYYKKYNGNVEVTMATNITKQKAKKILREGKARGKSLTNKQKKFFGAMAKKKKKK